MKDGTFGSFKAICHKLLLAGVMSMYALKSDRGSYLRDFFRVRITNLTIPDIFNQRWT